MSDKCVHDLAMAIAAFLRHRLASFLLACMALAAQRADASSAAAADVDRCSGECVANPADPSTLRKALGDLVRAVNPRYDVDDAMGYPLAVSGTTALVGALDFDEATGTPFGIVFAFEYRGDGWQQTQTLRPPRMSEVTGFGMALAIDGDTAVIGEPYGNAALPEQGYAVVYSHIGGEWQPQVELVAVGGQSGDGFGGALAVSGDTILVGAPGADANGAAYVFVRNGNAWAQQDRLIAGDGEKGDGFGGAVALLDDNALIGAPGDGIGRNARQGSAYVFVRAGTSWTRETKLVALDGAAFDRFGRSLALDDDGARAGSKGNTVDETVALIGAPGDDIGISIDQGSAYVFVHGATEWAQQEKLVNVDGAPADRSNELAGASVALSGNIALVGADGLAGTHPQSGGVIVYARSGDRWLRRAILPNTRPDSRGLGFAVALTPEFAFASAVQEPVAGNAERNGIQVWSRTAPVWPETQRLHASDAQDDLFGHSVAFGDTTALVGAPFADLGDNPEQGVVFVYGSGPESWERQARLVADDGAAQDQFGYSVALDGDDTAYVGALRASAGALPAAGAVYVFERAADAWVQTAKLTLLDPGTGDNFGAAIALEADTLLVGAPTDTIGGVMRGSVATFTRQGGVWMEGPKLFEPGAAEGDGYGWSIALAGDLLLVGAPAPFFSLQRAGSAYLYERTGTQWTRRQRFQAAGSALSDGFGLAVELGIAPGGGSDVAFFGAPLQEVDGIPLRGAVHVSTRDASGWGATAALASSATGATDLLGWALALDGAVLHAGALMIDVPGSGPPPGGALFRYELSASGWIETARTAPSDAPGAAFGYSLAANSSQVLVGAPQYSPSTGVQDIGAVYFAAEIGDRVFDDGFESP